MTEAERREALERIAAEVRGCTLCRLHESRTQAVPGEGHPSTEVLFVGEAPGLNEDRQGRPFVGAAGGFLTELLGSLGWSRNEVFITNIVKCRPPGNRDPEPDEIRACAPYLRRQVEVLDPALVVTLGRYSMGRFMPGARIGQAHGTTAKAPAETGSSDALVFAMYHPAAALHQASLRETLLDDMAGVPRALLDARERRGVARADNADREVVEAPGVEAALEGAGPEPEAFEPPGPEPLERDVPEAAALAPGAPETVPEPGPDAAAISEGAPEDLVPVAVGADAASLVGVSVVPDDGEPTDQLTLFT